MNQRERIEKILEEVQAYVQKDVAALLGASFSLSGFATSLVTKEEVLADLSGRYVLSHLDLVGEVEGSGCLLVRVKDAILLGGTLIMLPTAELEEVVAQDNYSADVGDAYGEIANIIAGSYSKAFEENYAKTCRMVRKDLELISPLKLDATGDDGFLSQLYCRVLATPTLGDRGMGQMVLLLPAAPLELDAEEVPADKISPVIDPEVSSSSDVAPPVVDPVVSSSADVAPPVLDPVVSSSSDVVSPVIDPVVSSSSDVAPSASPPAPPMDIKKNKKRMDALLSDCFEKMTRELSTLLGATVVVSDLQNSFLSKEAFFVDVVKGKQVVTDLEMSGDIVGHSYLALSLKDAIYMGGALIMLPPSELDIVVREEDFDDDAQDAYGEIANIINGVYSNAFKNDYREDVHLIRREMVEVAPLKVDISAEQPFMDQLYYVTSMALRVNDQGLGRLHVLFPAEAFGLIAPAQAEESVAPVEIGGLSRSAATAAPEKSSAARGSGVNTSASAAAVPEAVSADGSWGGQSCSCDVLLISDERHETEKIAKVLQERGYVVSNITFGDNVFDYISVKLKAVYLVMSELSEQAFGLAIKVSTGSSLPLIAAGPAWTKSKVLKAVKYGVSDILLTPAGQEDILENIDRNITSHVS
ncbi:chemotaxis protein CheX [Desulfotalea psychrophila]|uniref:Related to two-component system response regulator n=1 Tax=Desulfotalea psychrophila (strain LSv54 / DSM 12343) TaxID=177439 RepID=Q6AJU8_DESPS|nr:chemotaxis protein CheX [Desulfotalea psychrophila]CAG37378.1 related to two-component system response regulator [Desulfotalea psychrophila LSv54]